MHRYKPIFKEDMYDFHSLQLNLADCEEDGVSAFKAMQDLIPNNILYEDEESSHSYGKPRDAHITICYGFKNDNYKKLSSQLPAVTSDVNFKIGKIGSFRNDNKPFDVIYCEILSQNCKDLNRYIRNNYNVYVTYPVYTPHITIAYVQNGTCKEVEGIANELSGKAYSSSVLQFSHKDGYYMPIYLS